MGPILEVAPPTTSGRVVHLGSPRNSTFAHRAQRDQGKTAVLDREGVIGTAWCCVDGARALGRDLPAAGMFELRLIDPRDARGAATPSAGTLSSALARGVQLDCAHRSISISLLSCWRRGCAGAANLQRVGARR